MKESQGSWASRFTRAMQLDWKRRLLLWTGAIGVGLVITVFIRLAEFAFSLFQALLAHGAWWPALVTPCALALLAYFSSGKRSATKGSGIPQAIAALHIVDDRFRSAMLSVRIAAAKILMTSGALAAGASIGREGPCVHVGASLMYALGNRFGFRDPKDAGRFILAGSAAGLAAAFNAPLAGVMFAIEEVASAYEGRMSGIVITGVVLSGVITLGLLGNYVYFGTVAAGLSIPQGIAAVLLCGIAGGLGGGLFSRIILLGSRSFQRLAALRRKAPVAFAFGCGVVLVILGFFSHNAVYGTGYEQAYAILMHAGEQPHPGYSLYKYAANIVSYWSGIPGGLFSPALAVGAGLGRDIARLIPGAPLAAIALLGMAAYLSGVTQSPLTSTVICMEMTANQNLIIPILAAALIARTTSRVFCREPVYHAFAEMLEAQYRAERGEADPSPEARAAGALPEGSIASVR